MTGRLKNRYSSLKLRSKIAVLMTVLLSVLCILLFLANLAFFNYQYGKDAAASARQWMDVSVATLDRNLSAINSAVIDMAVNGDFANLLYTALYSEESNKLVIKAELQPYLAEIQKASPLIENVFLIDRGGTLYCRFDDTIQSGEVPSFDEFAEKGTGFGKERKSYFSKNRKVIPMSISFGVLAPSSYFELSGENDSVLKTIILLDSQRLHEEINSEASTFIRSSSYLTFNGEPIFEETEQNCDKKHTLTKTTSVSGLEYVMHINGDYLNPQRKIIAAVSLLSIFVTLLIAVVSVLKTADFLTRPFSQVMTMLSKIRDNTYDLSIRPQYRDESGELINAVNDMYITLQRQIETIKKEENQKYRYMSQMLTEQINPHFIYNTLETINMEIINGNTETAGAMIQDFALFLRCTLNNGNEAIELVRETAQVKAYVAIMNRRLNHSITFSCTLDEALENVVVPKLILQPLVENAIRHGFSRISDVPFPQIGITIRGTKNRFTIEVSDNGKGIDPEKAERALTLPEDKQTGVGLSNIKRRLSLYFKKAEIKIETIPFFRNTVSIDIEN